MTREVAKREIDSLDFYLQNHTDDYGEESHTAMMMAIKALEQQTCEDAVSREAVLDVIDDIDKTACMNEYHVIVDAIDKLPPVNPQPKTGHWIETAEEYYKAVNEYGGGVNEDTPYFVDDIACSECLAKYSVIDNETERFDHCPSCGTRMVEPQESEG